MASFSSSSRYSLASAEDFDFVCSLCKKKNATKEAKCYCTACFHYFCGTCKDFHDNLMSDHHNRVIGKDEMRKRGVLPTGAELTEMCEVHAGRLIELFCTKHRQVGCSPCMTIDHKSCQVEYIPNVAKDNNALSELKGIQADLERIKKDLVEVKALRRTDKIKLQADKDTIVTAVNEFHKSLIEIVQKLKKTALNSVDERFEENARDIEDSLRACDDNIQSIEDMLKSLTKPDDLNDSQIFVLLHKSKRAVSNMTRLCQGLKGNVGHESIKFIIEKGVESRLKQEIRIGWFEGHKVLRSIESRTNSSMKTGKDQRSCSLSGSCIVDQHHFIMADCTNFKLKLLNASFHIVDEIVFRHRPVDVCLVRPNVVAVTLWGQNLYFVLISPFLAHCKSVKLNHDCRSIAFLDDELYITDRDARVHVYDVTGTTLKRIIYTDAVGVEKLFAHPAEIATNSDGSKLYVANEKGGLVCFDRNGTFIWRLSRPDLLEPWGVCVDTNDNVYVCGFKSNNVLQLSPDGQCVGVLLKKKDGIVKPQSLAYDKFHNRLLVTLFDHDVLYAFGLK